MYRVHRSRSEHGNRCALAQCREQYNQGPILCTSWRRELKIFDVSTNLVKHWTWNFGIYYLAACVYLTEDIVFHPQKENRHNFKKTCKVWILCLSGKAFIAGEVLIISTNTYIHTYKHTHTFAQKINFQGGCRHNSVVKNAYSLFQGLKFITPCWTDNNHL